MTNLPAEQTLESIARFQSLLAGQYWRAKVDIESERIAADTVLLISSIKWVDDKQHTIILKFHPSHHKGDGEHRFLCAKFLECFEFCENGEEVRAQELLAIQGRVQALQEELVNTQTNPELIAAIVSNELQESTALVAENSNQEVIQFAQGSLMQAIGSGISAEKIESMKLVVQREAKIAQIKANWISNKTKEIGETINQMVPYFSEKSAAALAMTEDVREYVNKLTDGIGNLDLYVGKDVEVIDIKKGKSAPNDIPLTIVQQKLMMDEELAVFTDVDQWFDFSSQALFHKHLVANQALVDQIFPTERCILVMATTHRDIDYGAGAMVNSMLNQKNKTVFLMVRDGENLYQIYSPVESHLGASRLFPSKNEQDAIFRGFDGSQIKFEDIHYTDKLQLHERHALHYKRFLILLCGLDHRLKLFGDFYDAQQSLDFISMSFQEKYLHFLHDDDGEGLLPSAQKMPSVTQWIEQKNKHTRSGSRVFCVWHDLISRDTCPQAYGYDNWRRDYAFKYRINEEPSVKIVKKQQGQLIVPMQVKREYRDAVFNTNINLSSYHYHRSEMLGYLCIDNIELADIDYYINNRLARKHFIEYIKIFKLIRKQVQADLLAERDVRAKLLEAMLDNGITNDVKKANRTVGKAVAIWRAENNGKSLPNMDSMDPKVWKGLLDLMYRLVNDTGDDIAAIQAFMAQEQREILRISLDTKGQYLVYVEPHPSERNDIIEPHAWVVSKTLIKNKSGIFTEKSNKQVSLCSVEPTEQMLFESEQAKDWFDKKSLFTSFNQKTSLITNTGADALGIINKLMAGQDAEPEFFEELLDVWKEARASINESSKYVQEANLYIPIGLIAESSLLTALLYIRDFECLLYSMANEQTKPKLAEYYCSYYRKKDTALKNLTMGFDAKNVMIIAGKKRKDAGFYCDGSGEFQHIYQAHPANYLLSNTIAKYPRIRVNDSMQATDLDLAFGLQLPKDYCPCLVSYTHYITWNSDKEHDFNYLLDLVLCGDDGKPVTTVTNPYNDDAKVRSGSSQVFASIEDAEQFIERYAQTNHAELVRTEMVEGLLKRVIMKV